MFHVCQVSFRIAISYKFIPFGSRHPSMWHKVYYSHSHFHVIIPAVVSTCTLFWKEQRSQCKSSPTDSGTTTSHVPKEDYFYNYFPKKYLYQPKLPYPAWDDDWDGKEESSKSLEKGITRHIILIRHGQFDETHKEEHDEKRVLTPLGRQQAHLTGKRIRQMIHGYGTLYRPCVVTTLISSDMARAKETAAIIAQYLPKNVERAEPDPLLNEGIPAQIIPTRPELDILADWNKNGKRIEEAFQKYIVRSTKEVHVVEDDNDYGADSASNPDILDQQHEFQVIVCHGNVIRYFFCRALQLPPEAWLRLSTYNCSLTYLMIRPNGRVSARMMGDIGHLGYSKSSFSMHHGFVP